MKENVSGYLRNPCSLSRERDTALAAKLLTLPTGFFSAEKSEEWMARSPVWPDDVIASETASRHQPMNWRDSIWVFRLGPQWAFPKRSAQCLGPYSENKGYASNPRRFIFVWEWVNIYIYTPLCKPGRERRWPCACAINLQSGRGGMCVSSPLCSDCCARLLRDWPPVSAFGRERGSRQHPLLVEHSRPNCRVICAFESPNTTKVSKNTSKCRWICCFWQKKKSPGGWFVCVIISAWSGGKGGGTLFALANHYIFTVKNKTWRYCCYNNLLLFIY